MEIALGIFVFFTIFLLIIAIASMIGFLKNPVEERMDRLTRPKSISSSHTSIAKDPESFITNLGQHFAPKDNVQRTLVKQRFAHAGYYSDSAYYTYWSMKILLIFILPLLVYLFVFLQNIPTMNGLLPGMASVGMGMFLPDLFLYFKKRSRHEQIFCSMPDTLDLLVVCIEAGLGLDAALQKVSEEFHLSNPILSEELSLTCAVIRMGHPRNEALRDLSERTGVSDLKALTAVLIQADRFGTSMAQALRVHADDMRTRRRQRAEELAAKTTVKLLLPLVLFIFPSIFVVLAGPAVIRILDTLVKK